MKTLIRFLRIDSTSLYSDSQKIRLRKYQNLACIPTFMPPKRNQRWTITPPLSSPSVPAQAHFHSNKTLRSNPTVNSKDIDPQLSDLQPKPCHCCGREITPRSKWKKNWEEIRYCSDQCRSWPGKIKLFTYQGGSGGEIEMIDGEIQLKEQTPQQIKLIRKNDSNLERCIDHDEGNQSQDPSSPSVPKYELLINELDLDAWIESTIWSVARSSSKQNLKTLQDVAKTMDDDMDKLSDIQLANAVQEYIQHSHVGLRELIRRAARRLVVFPRQNWASTKRGLTGSEENDKIVLLLTQKGGRQRLETLYDVSHAKNEIEISISQE